MERNNPLTEVTLGIAQFGRGARNSHEVTRSNGEERLNAKEKHDDTRPKLNSSLEINSDQKRPRNEAQDPKINHVEQSREAPTP